MKHHIHRNRSVTLKPLVRVVQNGVLALAGVLLLSSGCAKEEKPENKPASSAPTTAAPSTSPASTNAPAPAQALKASPESDKAWTDLQKALKPPPKPESWQTEQPSEEEIKKFNQEMAKFAGQAADLAKGFYTKFPNAPQSNTARRREKDLLAVAVEQQTNLVERVKQVEKDYEASAAAAEDKALKKRFQDVQAAGYKAQPQGDAAMLDAYVAGALAVKKEFPHHEDTDQILLQLIQMTEQSGNIEKAKPLVEAIVKGNGSDELKEYAQMMTLRYTFVGKEIDIKFKAVDGREVDLAKMRGKVVLIDFWASWCGPCMMEMPRLKQTYTKWHDKGLEVIGISLDKSEEAMNRALARTEIAWPIHFEGEGKNNHFAKQFGIMPIPEFWLIDKKGILRNREARANLEAEVEKLLAEKDPS